MIRIGKYTIEEAVDRYYPVAQKMARGDDDLQQELILWVIDNLVYRDDFNEKYILQRMHLQIKAYKRGYLKLSGYGRSIDLGDPTGRKHNYTHIDSLEKYGVQDIEAGLEMYFRTSPEQEALFRVDYGKLVASLTDMEKRYLGAKLCGLTWTEINELKIVPSHRQHGLKMSIKKKIREYLDEW